MSTTTNAATQSPVWNDAQRVLDLDNAAAIMTIWAMLRFVRPPFVNTDLGYTIYLAASITAMLALVARSPARPLRLPTTPSTLRRYLPLHNNRRPVEVAALTAGTVVLASLARFTEVAVAIFTNPKIGGCGTYNDDACTNNGPLVDFLGTLNAGIGEELVYRLALLTIVARFVGMKWAIAIQAVIWGVSHTWFDNGYNSSIVTGIIAVGLVYALVTLATRSVWPAIFSHTLNNITADIDAHAPNYRWTYIAAYAAVFGVSVYLIAVAARTKQAALKADKEPDLQV